jgi:hypothetical protein
VRMRETCVGNYQNAKWMRERRATSGFTKETTGKRITARDGSDPMCVAWSRWFAGRARLLASSGWSTENAEDGGVDDDDTVAGGSKGHGGWE